MDHAYAATVANSGDPGEFADLVQLCTADTHGGARDTQPDPNMRCTYDEWQYPRQKNPAELDAAAGLKKGISKDDLLRASAPIVDFLLRLVFGIAVLGLKLALELFPVSIDLRQLIVSELTPLLFHLAGKLLPVSFDDIPIHG